MEITFIEKKYKATAHFRNVVSDKLAKLDRYFDGDVTAKVFCSVENKTEKLEVNLISKGLMYRSEAAGLNNYENIDLLLPKLERQIVRSKQKAVKSRKGAPKDLSFEYLAEEPDMTIGEIVKKKSFELDPMTTEEAKDAIERLGHTFYIFLNAETGKVCVLYKRRENKYGLIEVTF